VAANTVVQCSLLRRVVSESDPGSQGCREEFEVKNLKVRKTAFSTMALAALATIAFAQQDRYTLKVPDGLSFSEIKGYETWQDIAVSETQTSVKAILGNPELLTAYRQGIPDNGKSFPEGVKFVKIEWLKKKNPVSPYFVEIPDTLKTVSFIVKDSKRFPTTNGWAYAQFEYDPASATFKPSQLSKTGHECGYACHTIVAKRDYVFTAYPKR
jgi:Cytochrome P460